MPNYVYSTFGVSGDPKEIARFCKESFRSVKGDEDSYTGIVLDLPKFSPPYPEFNPPPREYWENAAWETKVIGYDVHIFRRANGTLDFSFTTNWDFPTEAFRAMAAEYPTLLFSGSAFEENHEFELLGDFNGPKPWGPGKLNWITF